MRPAALQLLDAHCNWRLPHMRSFSGGVARWAGSDRGEPACACVLCSGVVEGDCALGLLKLAGLTDMWSDDQPKCLLVAGVKHRCSGQAASTSFEASTMRCEVMLAAAAPVRRTWQPFREEAQASRHARHGHVQSSAGEPERPASRRSAFDQPSPAGGPVAPSALRLHLLRPAPDAE